MMGAIDRVRSVLTNQMQENILYLCLFGTIEPKVMRVDRLYASNGGVTQTNKMGVYIMPASIRKLSSALCLFCSIN